MPRLVYLFYMERVDREILEAVAQGRMTPEEAAARLEQGAAASTQEDTSTAVARAGQVADEPGQADGATAPNSDPAPAARTSGESGREGRATQVRIAAAARTVRVIGDPSVNEAEIDGPHRAWREGDTLVVSGGEDTESGFSFRSRRRSHRDWRDWSDLAEWRRITEPLVVRVNPGLGLTVELSAGSLSVLGMHGPVGADLAAGSARFESVTGPLDISTRAGSVRVQGRLAEGSSRIRCDAGSVSVRLDPGSSVRVRAHVDLGRVRFHGPGGDSSGTGEVVVGGGGALLEIDATMASVDIMVHDPMVASPAGR
jgi:hypothetical protein